MCFRCRTGLVSGCHIPLPVSVLTGVVGLPVWTVDDELPVAVLAKSLTTGAVFTVEPAGVFLEGKGGHHLLRTRSTDGHTVAWLLLAFRATTISY